MEVLQATIYHNPKCSKSRAALEYLEKYNIDAKVVPYMKTGLTKTEILNILELLDCGVINIIRVDDRIFMEHYTSKNILLSKSGYINALVSHPSLLERPIILFEKMNVGAICRSEDSLESLFKYIGMDNQNDTERRI